MPWAPADATRHDKQANTKAKRRKWSAIANAILSKTGDDVLAIKTANARTEALDRAPLLFEGGIDRINRQLARKKPPGSWGREASTDAGLEARKVYKQTASKIRAPNLASVDEIARRRIALAVQRAHGLRMIDAVRAYEKTKKAPQAVMASEELRSPLILEGAKRLARIIAAKAKKAGFDRPAPGVVPLGKRGAEGERQGTLIVSPEHLKIAGPTLAARVATKKIYQHVPLGLSGAPPPRGRKTTGIEPSERSSELLSVQQQQRRLGTSRERAGNLSHAIDAMKRRERQLNRTSLVGHNPNDTPVVQPPTAAPNERQKTPTVRLKRQTSGA